MRWTLYSDEVSVFENIGSAETSDWTAGDIVTEIEKGSRSCLLQGPGRYDGEDAEMVIELEDSQDRVVVAIPVALLANHLRQAGWTVTPPPEDEP